MLDVMAQLDRDGQAGPAQPGDMKAAMQRNDECLMNEKRWAGQEAMLNDKF